MSHYLTLAAIHKGEHPFIKEWIEYHLLVGVEHFYLCCNDDNEKDSLDILQPYINRGLVEQIHVLGNSGNRHVDFYNNCLRTVKSKWIGFIDIDEFIIPMKKNYIHEVLVDYENYGGLVINWKLFGTNLENNPKSQINELLYCNSHNHIKSIIQPELTIHCPLTHFFSYKSSYFSVNENFTRVNEHSCTPSFNKIALNHYHCRSKEYWINVKNKRGRSDIGGYDQSWYPLEKFNNFNKMCSFYDDFAKRKFGEEVARRLDLPSSTKIIQPNCDKNCNCGFWHIKGRKVNPNPDNLELCQTCQGQVCKVCYGHWR